MEKQLKDLYYNANTGFTGVTKFYKKAKEINPFITLNDAKAFLDKQYTFQINRQGIRPKYYRTILANKPKDNYQMDIMIYDRYADGGYKHILSVVDVNSRYAMSIPIKSRKVGDTDEMEGLLTSIKKIFDTLGKPNNLNSDNEFFQSKEIQRYFADNDIKHHVSEKDELNKNAIIERYNRTLAKLLQRWRVGTGRTDWHNALPELVKNYNTTYHRTIRQKPIDVWEGKKPNNQTNIHTFETELEIGDHVRIKVIKGIFDKGDALSYSPEEYVITDRKDGVENGIKLKKFRLRNIATNQILRKPREWFKDYELKKIDNIVEKYDTETNLAEKSKVAVETQIKEKEQELEKEKEKVKELENIVPYTEQPKNKKVKRFVKDEKKLAKMEKELDELKIIKPNTNIADRRKQLDRFSTDVNRRLSTFYGLKTLVQYTKPNGRKAWKDRPISEIKDEIIKHEKRLGSIV